MPVKPLPQCTVVSGGEAVLPVTDRILLGEGLVETLRVREGRVEFASAHWARLQAAILQLGLNIALPFTLWQESLQRCVDDNALHSGGIKVILSGGTAGRGLWQQGADQHLLLQGFAFEPSASSVSLIRAPWQRDAANPVYQVKSVSYLEAICASRYAREQGYDDVLFFNMHEHVMETTIANLFILSQGMLFTPPLADGVLGGVVRGQLLQMNSLAGLKISERSLTYEDLLDAQALFICNSLQGMVPVQRLDAEEFACDDLLRTTIQQALDSRAHD